MADEDYIPLMTEIASDFRVQTDGHIIYTDNVVAMRRDQRFTVGIRSQLDPFEKEDRQFHELSFAISVFDDERYSTELIFSPADAKPYLPDEVRDFIMPSVCAQIGALVREVGPELIFRQTWALAPPEKALFKHQMITDTLVGIGYVQKQHDIDADGGLFWVFEKAAESRDG